MISQCTWSLFCLPLFIPREILLIVLFSLMQDLNCGKTALHLVAEKSSLADVQFLVETCKADINRVTYSGCSALHIAAGRGDIAVVAYLISMGADHELLTDEGDQALDLSSSEQVCLG